MEQLIDKLIGVDISHKSDEIIRSKDYLMLEAEYNSLKSFWSRAFFLHYLQKHPEKHLAAVSGKILRRFRAQDPGICKRYLEPHINEIKRKTFAADGMKDIWKEVLNIGMSQGQQELVTICRAKYNADGDDWFVDELLKKVALNSNDKKRITQLY